MLVLEKLYQFYQKKNLKKKIKDYRSSDRYKKGEPYDDEYPIEKYDHISRKSKASRDTKKPDMHNYNAANWSNGEMVRAQIPSYLSADKSRSERKKNEFLQSKK